MIPYLDLINHKATTFITLLKPGRLIEFVETTMKPLSPSKVQKATEVKIIDLLDYKVCIVKEGGHSMIAFAKLKHCGVRYKKMKHPLLPLKNEVVGLKELKWSALTIFNNLKVLYKNGPAYSKFRHQVSDSNGDAQPEYLNSAGIESKYDEANLSSDLDDEYASPTPWEQNPDEVKKRRDKFNKLIKLYK